MIDFDAWFKKVDELLDQCLIKSEGDITITEVDGILLNKYASLKLENMDLNEGGDVANCA